MTITNMAESYAASASQSRSHVRPEPDSWRSFPWQSRSELAMVRSFFYPDRSPLDPAPERRSTPYRDSTGKFVNTFIPPTFKQRDKEFQESRRLSLKAAETNDPGFSYFQAPGGSAESQHGQTAHEFIPDNPPDCRMEAIKIVQTIWVKFGTANSLPHAVVATTQLTAAIFHAERMRKKFYEGDYDYVTEMSVESTLATALGKFVTGLVDRDIRLETNMPDEKKTSTSNSRKRKNQELSHAERPEADIQAKLSNSMLSNAAQIGLPTEFVELRHQITHEATMPSISEMKRMAFEALDWLWEKYWLKLDVGDDVWGTEERELVKRREESWEELDAAAQMAS